MADTTKKIISDIIKLLREEENLKNNIERSSFELATEEHNYNLNEMEKLMVSSEIENLQGDLDLTEGYLNTIESLRGTVRATSVMMNFVAKCAETMEPTSLDMDKKILQMRAGFNKFEEVYRDLPNYQAILKEEALCKELVELIAQQKLKTSSAQ